MPWLRRFARRALCPPGPFWPLPPGHTQSGPTEVGQTPTSPHCLQVQDLVTWASPGEEMGAWQTVPSRTGSGPGSSLGRSRRGMPTLEQGTGAPQHSLGHPALPCESLAIQQARASISGDTEVAAVGLALLTPRPAPYPTPGQLGSEVAHPESGGQCQGRVGCRSWHGHEVTWGSDPPRLRRLAGVGSAYRQGQLSLLKSLWDQRGPPSERRQAWSG